MVFRRMRKPSSHQALLPAPAPEESLGTRLGKNMPDFDKLAFPGAGCVQVVETTVRDCAIESVVVYADRAEVKRRVPVNLAAGKNEVVVHGLSTCINKNSIRLVGVYMIHNEVKQDCHGVVAWIGVTIGINFMSCSKNVVHQAQPCAILPFLQLVSRSQTLYQTATPILIHSPGM